MSKSKYNLCKQEVRELVKKGKNADYIAKFYGCSKSLVYVFCKQNNIYWPKLNLVGYEYHWLEVIKKSGSKNGQVYWICKCKCGKELELPTRTITRNERKSCGCWMKSKQYSRSHYLWSGYGDIHGKWWSNIQKGAANRSHKFELDIEDAWNLFLQQDRKCAYSGIVLKFASTMKKYTDTTASLDRINSSKGYTLDNVQWVHKTVNLMKQGLSDEDFKYWIKTIGDNLEIQTKESHKKRS